MYICTYYNSLYRYMYFIQKHVNVKKERQNNRKIEGEREIQIDRDIHYAVPNNIINNLGKKIYYPNFLCIYLFIKPAFYLSTTTVVHTHI